MRTVAHELRRTLRFEADTRERAAPLVIVLDTLVPPFFICEGRRGSLCSRFALLSDGARVLRWTTHCKNTRSPLGTNQLNHSREHCLIGEKCMSFAKKRFVPEQSVMANVHKRVGASSSAGAQLVRTTPTGLHSGDGAEPLVPVLLLALGRKERHRMLASIWQ